jgi:thiol-disulfide isomerase/thioredoxin
MSKLLLMLLFSCAAELEITNSKDSAKAPDPPPEFGVNERTDCDQSAIGSNVCNLALLDQNGELWELYDYAGTVVLLDFSTVWCGPCQVAGHRAQPIQDDYGNQVVFATVLIEGATGEPTTKEDVETWVTNHGVTTAPVLQASREYVMDPAGITGYLVGGFPTYVYIDKNMTIHTGHVGFNEDFIRTTLNGLL